MNPLTSRFFILLSIAMFFLTAVPHALTAQQIRILVNNGSFNTVEEAGSGEQQVDWWDSDLTDDRACTECFAALELARFLPSCIELSAGNIHFESPGSMPPEDDVIIVGSRHTNIFIKKSKELPDSLKLETDESFWIRAYEENNKTVTIIEGKDRVGTLYGVYEYLELLGVRFYGLGEKGMVYPVEKQQQLPKNVTVVENPSYLTRGYHAWEDRGNDEFFLWMARNRMNFWTSAEEEVHLLKKLGMKLADGGHMIQRYFLNPDTEYPYNHPKFKGDEDKPKDPYNRGKEYTGDTNSDGKLTYFEAHPEWYGLYNGKRSDNVKTDFGDNYCTSNVDATKELAKNMIQSLIDGDWRYVDFINFWMMDASYKWCECENCKKQGTFTDRLMNVLHIVQGEIDKARRKGRLPRKVQLSSLAYLETLTPPTRPLPRDFDYDNISITFFPIERCYNHTFADPSCTEFNRRLVSNYLPWTSGPGRYFKGTMFIGEYYNVSYLKSMPMLYTRIMAADIPWYYQTGTRHFHYMHTPTRLWGTWTLNQYLLARLLWDVDTDTDALLNEYFRRYYPTSCKQTMSFYRNLEKGMESFKAIRYWGWKKKLKDETMDIYPKKHFQYEPSFFLMNDGIDLIEMKDYITATRRDIDAALLMCADETEKLRLLEDERRFAYGEDMVNFHYHIYRTAMFHHKKDKTRASREMVCLERYAEKLKATHDLLQVSSTHANAKNGLDATQAADLYNFFKEKYGEK